MYRYTQGGTRFHEGLFHAMPKCGKSRSFFFFGGGGAPKTYKKCRVPAVSAHVPCLAIFSTFRKGSVLFSFLLAHSRVSDGDKPQKNPKVHVEGRHLALVEPPMALRQHRLRQAHVVPAQMLPAAGRHSSATAVEQERGDLRKIPQ